MEKMSGIDFNGNRIIIGDDVLIPKPNVTDTHKTEFVGKVRSFKDNGNAIIIDNNGETFDIVPKRVEVIVNHWY